MLVVEKTHRINVEIIGEGEDALRAIIKQSLPDAIISDEDEETVLWEETELAKAIEASNTPGKLLRAYRERAGLTLVELAKTVHTKYPNISAMENDRRVIGLRMAKKLGQALKVDFRKFLME